MLRTLKESLPWIDRKEIWTKSTLKQTRPPEFSTLKEIEISNKSGPFDIEIRAVTVSFHVSRKTGDVHREFKIQVSTKWMN